MKGSRNKSRRRSTKDTKAVQLDGSETRQDTGLSPSKRHREKLNNVMDELSELLPLSSDAKSGLDRLSILKLTVSFFQTQNLIKSSGKTRQSSGENKKRVQVQGVSLSEMALEAVGGFFIVLTENGNVYYVSENVKNYLGYSQTRLMHQEFFSHVHPDDLQGLKSCFEGCPSKKLSFAKKEEHELPFTVPDSRQECYCNVRCHAGRLSSHISPFYYKCFRFYGHLKMVKKSEKAGSQYGFFALCSPVSRSENITKAVKVHVERYTCKMDAAMANLQVDSRGLKVLRFNEQDLMGKSAYFFFHPDDLSSMALVHERLMQDFKVSTTFRVMKGNGKWQWVRGAAYSIIKSGQIEGMVSNNVLVSDEEGAYYKAQNLKEIKEWKEAQEKVLTKYQSSSCSSTCSSPRESGSWSSDTESSFQHSNPAGFITSSANGGTLIQTSSMSQSPSSHNGYALPSPKSDCSTAAVGKATTKSSPNALHEQFTSPLHYNPDVASRSEALGTSQEECSAIIDNEMISIIKELQSSLIDGGVDSATQPFSSPSQKTTAFPIQRPFVMTTNSTDGTEGISGSVPASSFMTNPYPVGNGYGFHSVGGVFDAPHIDEMALLQNSQPFVDKHLNPAYLQQDAPKNNGIAEENNVYLKDCDTSVARLHEDSFKDFEVLPLCDIESILSHESHSYSTTPDSFHSLPSNLPILEHVLMDAQSHEHKPTATNIPVTTEVFQTESDLHKSQANPSLDVVASSDLVSFTFTVANGMESGGRMDLLHKRDNGAYLEHTKQNHSFADHHSYKNHNAPNSSCDSCGPVDRANSMVKFNPETAKHNLSIQPAVAWMDKK